MINCKYCNKEISPLGKIHEKFCIENPNRESRSGSNNPHYGKKGSNQYVNGAKMKQETKDKISIKSKLQKPSNEIKAKISEAMKVAHNEGRAWNIGMSRWNNEPSYPEIFFMKVIENEFIDKEYKTEHPMSIYSFDFAWIDKMKAIEIDGSQHERFDEIKDRDNRKDMLATKNGWQVLRIKWKDMFNDPQKWIKIAYEFIH
tara:strand:+ start:79 stop:681 length:603 start_codon:yes stop_codon:yes gene_type:complete